MYIFFSFGGIFTSNHTVKVSVFYLDIQGFFMSRIITLTLNTSEFESLIWKNSCQICLGQTCFLQSTLLLRTFNVILYLLNIVSECMSF